MIDDQAVQKSKVAQEQESRAHRGWRNAVLGMVTDKLHVDPDVLKTLHEGVRFGDSKLDRRLLYEVSRFRYSSDEEDYDSGDGFDQSSSDLISDIAISPNGLSADFQYG